MMSWQHPRTLLFAIIDIKLTAQAAELITNSALLLSACLQAAAAVEGFTEDL